MYIHAPNVQLSITSYGVPSSPVQLSFVLHRPSSVDDDVIVPLLAAVVKMWFSCYCEGKMFIDQIRPSELFLLESFFF